MPAFESRRVRSQPLTVTCVAAGARPARMSARRSPSRYPLVHARRRAYPMGNRAETGAALLGALYPKLQKPFGLPPA